MMHGKGRASRKLFVSNILVQTGLDASEKHSKESFAVNMHITAMILNNKYRAHSQALDI